MLEGYESRVGRIKDYFSGKNPKIKSITPAMIDAFFKFCLKYGKINQKTGKPEPLSVRSVRSYKGILNAAFTQARIDGLLLLNPVSDISVGKKPNSKYKQGYLFLTEDEVTALMNFLAEHYPRLLPFAFFGTYYGLRRSEILGLKWNAIHEFHPITEDNATSESDNSENTQKESLGYISIQHTVVRVRNTIADEKVKTVESHRELDLFPTAVKCLNGIKLQQQEDIQTTLDIYAHYIKHKDNRAGNDMEQASAKVSDLFD